MSVFHNNALIASGAAAAGAAAPGVRSLRFNDGETTSLTRTPSSAGNRKTWTWSGWVKRSELGGSGAVLFSGYSGSVNADLYITFVTSATSSGSEDAVALFSPPAGSDISISSNAIFRDTSAWQSIVVACDTTQSTAADRVKIYVNGAEVTYNTTSYPAQNATLAINDTKQHAVGSRPIDGGGNSNGFSGYMADIYFIDGLQLAPTSFGSYDSNGVWQRGTYSGTYGTNGFHILDFENEGTIGDDSSGNSNDYTANNLSDTAGAGNDVLLDFPVNGSESDTGAGGEVSGNYCALNALKNAGTLSNGNLEANFAAGSEKLTVGTIGVQSGKWYWEVTKTGGSYGTVGIADNETSTASFVGQTSNSWGYATDGNKYHNSSSGSSYGNSWGAGDVIGIAFDADAGNLYFYKNGSVQNSGTAAFTGLTSGYYFPAVGNQNFACTCNFGARPFAHSAPSGYKALCTTNLSTPTIADGSDYFEAKTYTGNGSSQSITTSFSPDFVWIKQRNTARYHSLYDIVRGTNQLLQSQASSAEVNAGSSGVTAFGSTSFTVGSDNGINQNGGAYVGWAWDAGSSTVSNTDGSITSQVRANPSAGFSIVTYTGNGTSGATVGHGLSAAPAFWMLKARSATSDWVVRHTSIANTHYLLLNSDIAAYNPISDVTGDADPTNSVIPVGDSDSNNNNVTHVGYVFAPVAGYSAIGVATGTGTTDGPYVYTGFRVAFLIYKRSDGTSNWLVYDTTRNPSNPGLYVLSADNDGGGNTYDAHNNQLDIDFLSNGFKVRSSNSDVNTSGASYVYYAVAENPFQANGGLAR